MKLNTTSIVAVFLSASTGLTAAAAPPSELQTAVNARWPDHPPQAYSYALVHLRGAGTTDALVLIRDPDYCGSGGCVLMILEGEPDGSFKVISSSTVSREPLYLLPHSSHGWHDLTTFVAGGGSQACNALMRFSGRKYPSNPSTVPCASQAEMTDATAIKLDQ